MNRWLIGTCVALLMVVSSNAQFDTRYVEIRDIRIGFKASRFTSERDEAGAAAPVAKWGFWAPVSFRLEVLRGTDKKLWVEIDSTDDERNTTRIRWPLGDVVRNPQATNQDDKYRLKGSFIEPYEMQTVPMVRLGASNLMSKIQLRIVAENDGSYDNASAMETIEPSYIREP